jgi:hypothetical protein
MAVISFFSSYFSVSFTGVVKRLKFHPHIIFVRTVVRLEILVHHFVYAI